MVFIQACIAFTSLYIGINTTSDCSMAVVILKEVFEIDQAKSKTISISSGMGGNGSFKSRLIKRLSGIKSSNT